MRRRQAALALLLPALALTVLRLSSHPSSPGLTWLEATGGVTSTTRHAGVFTAMASSAGANVAAANTTTTADPGQGGSSTSAAPASSATTSAGGTGSASSTPVSTPSAGASAARNEQPASATSTTASPEVITTTTSTTAAPRPVYTRRSEIEAQVLALTNADRAAAGLAQVSRNGCLDSVASGWSEQMARTGAHVHNPASGRGVNDCRGNVAWGDNIGRWPGCNSRGMEELWMSSPPHRANLLGASFRFAGIGVWSDPSDECWFQVLFSS